MKLQKYFSGVHKSLNTVESARYARLLIKKQKYRCAACHKKIRRIAIDAVLDHDHWIRDGSWWTKRPITSYRGVVCYSCNALLGSHSDLHLKFLRQRLKQISQLIMYLERYKKSLNQI